MISIGYTPPGGVRIELMNLDGSGHGLRVRGLVGTGAPAMQHQTVATPNRDGATWIRVVADQRFVLVTIKISAASWADLWDRQLALIAALNPKQGLGVLDVTPDPSNPTYTIDAILNGGLGMDTPPPGTLTREMTLSFQCPDPAWRVLPLNDEEIVVPGAGISIPMSIPLSVSEATASEVLANTGHLESYPVLTLTGAFTSPRITNETTDQMVWFSGLEVASGEELVIDMDRRTATLDGVNVMPFRSADSRAWALARGNNTITVEVETGTVTMTVDWYTRLLGI